MNADELHLDDETISAALDDEAIDDDARAHLDGCAVCRARLDRFGRVASAVRAPIVSPSPAMRDDAILAALSADAPPAQPKRNFTPWLAAAAVIVLLLVAVPLIGALSSDNGRDQAATSARDDTASSSAGGTTGDAAAKAARPLDLGALDAGNLAAVVGRQVGGAPTSLAAPNAAPNAASAPAERSTAQDEGAGGAAGGAAGESLAADEGRACASQLHASGAEVLFARGTWDDRPAVVFAYRSGDDVSAYVVNPPDCRILHFVRFRAGP
jgi:anti-sigma factor RsiW